MTILQGTVCQVLCMDVLVLLTKNLDKNDQEKSDGKWKWFLLFFYLKNIAAILLLFHACLMFNTTHVIAVFDVFSFVVLHWYPGHWPELWYGFCNCVMELSCITTSFVYFVHCYYCGHWPELQQHHLKGYLVFLPCNSMFSPPSDRFLL